MSSRRPHDSPPGEPDSDGGRLGGLQSVVEIVSPRVAVVSLVGNVDLSSYDVIEGLLDTAQRDVLIDLTRCEFIDSTGIGALIAARGAATARGQRLALLVRPDQHAVRSALRISRLEDILEVHTSRRAAFDSFRDGAGSR
jgi:anti-anti-sigma factor